jgi:hypothetical protein
VGNTKRKMPAMYITHTRACFIRCYRVTCLNSNLILLCIYQLRVMGGAGALVDSGKLNVERFQGAIPGI